MKHGAINISKATLKNKTKASFCDHNIDQEGKLHKIIALTSFSRCTGEIAFFREDFRRGKKLRNRREPLSFGCNELLEQFNLRRHIFFMITAIILLTIFQEFLSCCVKNTLSYYRCWMKAKNVFCFNKFAKSSLKK